MASKSKLSSIRKHQQRVIAARSSHLRITKPIKIELGRHSGRPAYLKVTGTKQELAQVDAYIDPFQRFKGWGALPLTPVAVENAFDVAGTDIELDPEVKEWLVSEVQVRRLLDGTLTGGIRTAFKTPQHAALYGFQADGVSFMTMTSAVPANREGVRVLQCDDPRLGKTIQTAVSLFTTEVLSNTPALVVCLKSLVDYWVQQLEQWTECIYVHKLEGSIDDRLKQLTALVEDKVYPNVIVTNWETLRKIKEVPASTRKKIVTVIGDEAHVMRNRKTLVAEGMHCLRPRNAILLTATPLERGPQEYFSYLKFLRPWEFSSYWRYVGWFCETEYNGFGNDIVGPRNIKLLRDLMYPMMLRRHADEVADVPPKTFETIPCALEPEFELRYNELRSEVMSVINDMGDEIDLPNVVTQLTRLRQLSSAPHSIGYGVESPKLWPLVELVQERFKEEKIVIFCAFNDTLRMLKDHLGAEAVYFSGSQEEVDDFNSPNTSTRVFISTPQKGGIGQTLGASSIIIYYDLPLSSTLMRQSMERTTLIGKLEPQLIITLAATQIDHTVASLLRSKLDTISDVDIITQVIAAERQAHEPAERQAWIEGSMHG